MLDGAVTRARRDFGTQPQLQGELLSELGRMYMRLEAAESAVPVLEESIRVLEGRAAPDDPALNKSRVFLASALLQTSDFVVITAPHTPRTAKMFRRPQFQRMKPTAYIVNCARGGVVWGGGVAAPWARSDPKPARIPASSPAVQRDRMRRLLAAILPGTTISRIRCWRRWRRTRRDSLSGR